MANYDVLKVDGSKSGSVELSDAVFAIEPNNSVLSKLLIYNVRHYAKVHILLRIVQLYVVVDVNHGDKRNRSCTSRYYPRSNGGVVVVSYSDQLQEAIHIKCLRKMRRLALRSALSFKVQEKDSLLLILLVLTPKTKEFKMC